MHELTPYFSLLSSFDNSNVVAIDLAHNVFLVGAVLARKPERVLELGVGSGYVTNSLLHALRFNHKGRLTSVDNWSDWGGAEPAFASSLRAAGVTLLVSDADHFHSAAWVDQHLRIVQHDGFLFFHDTNQPRMFPGLATVEGHDKAPPAEIWAKTTCRLVENKSFDP
jgi:hypothetical protein